MDTDENAEEMFTYQGGRSLRHGRGGVGSQHANKRLCFCEERGGQQVVRPGKWSDGKVYMHAPE